MKNIQLTILGLKEKENLYAILVNMSIIYLKMVNVHHVIIMKMNAIYVK